MNDNNTHDTCPEISQEERDAIIEKDIDVVLPGGIVRKGKFYGRLCRFPILHVDGTNIHDEYSWDAAKRIADKGTVTYKHIYEYR